MNQVLLSLELEGLPPTVNHLYRSTKGGRRYKTAEGREYQEQVSANIAKWWGTREIYTGAVELRILFETANNRRWDIDNRVKALQDCLTMGGVLKDDRQVDILHVERRYTGRSRTHITLIVL